jgi:hypothetical protein
MSTKLTKQDVLRKTHEMLATAQRGLEDLTGDDPTRRFPGLYNVATFGRSVTLVLQNMRTVDRLAFNAWYAPFQAEMDGDRLMGYFTSLRNEILKEGPPHLANRTETRNLDMRDLAPLISNPPPGGKNWFVGDERGGSGWIVELPDGSHAKYYMRLPPEIDMRFSLHTPDAPIEHLGQPLEDTSVQTLSTLYVAYLTRLVTAAEAHFGS